MDKKLDLNIPYWTQHEIQSMIDEYKKIGIISTHDMQDYKVIQEDNCAKVYVKVPGVNKDSIDIRLHTNLLAIKVSPCGKFVTTPRNYLVDMEYFYSTKITAVIEKGVLEITIPYKTKYNQNVPIKQDTDEC